MQVAFVYGKKPNSTLTRIFTGSTCYHVGFTDGEWFWDMHQHRRVGPWKGRYPAERVILVDCPVQITAALLDQQVLDQTVAYGWRDYLAFAFRWAYHLVGKSTRNYGGEICSEWVGNVLRAMGWDRSFEEVEAPADLELAILGRKDAINPERTRRFGVLFNPSAVWWGAHWSPSNRRWCINLLPCVTLWVTMPGGKVPDRAMR